METHGISNAKGSNAGTIMVKDILFDILPTIFVIFY